MSCPDCASLSGRVNQQTQLIRKLKVQRDTTLSYLSGDVQRILLKYFEPIEELLKAEEESRQETHVCVAEYLDGTCVDCGKPTKATAQDREADLNEAEARGYIRGLKAAAKTTQAHKVGEGNEGRCIHGVWAADHCYTCESSNDPKEPL